MTGMNMDRFKRNSAFIEKKLQEMLLAIDSIYPNAYKVGIEGIIDRFREDQFRVVVVGEFSRGKSYFISALLGKKILPSSAIPTTTVINKIEYSESPVFKLEYHNPSIPDATLTEEEFKAIKAVPKPLAGDVEKEELYKEQIKEILAIKWAKVGYPLELLKNNVEIIDTPGLNDIEEMRGRITQEFIPQSDAAIFVLSAKKILSNSEMLFLEWIQKEDISRIFFVVNHADLLKTDEDREKIMAYARERLEEKFPTPEIHMISSKIALDFRRRQNGEEVKGKARPFEESGFIGLEKTLSSFLENERGISKLEKPIAGGLRIAEEVKSKIAIERNTLYQSVTELEQRIKTMVPELNRFRTSMDSIKNAYKLKIMGGKDELLRFMEIGLNSIASTAARTVQSYQGDINSDAIQFSIEAETVPMLSRLQTEVKRRQHAIISSAIEQAQNKYIREWGELENTLSDVLMPANELSRVEIQAISSTYDTSFMAAADDSTKTGIAAVGAGLIGLNVIGTVGLAGLFFAPILVPIAFLGIGGLLNSFFGDGNRQKSLAKVRAQVEENYRMQIPQIIREFEETWDAHAEAASIQFFVDTTSKVEAIENQLNTILESKRLEEKKVTGREQLLSEVEHRVNETATVLRNVLRKKEVSLV